MKSSLATTQPSRVRPESGGELHQVVSGDPGLVVLETPNTQPGVASAAPELGHAELQALPRAADVSRNGTFHGSSVSPILKQASSADSKVVPLKSSKAVSPPRPNAAPPAAFEALRALAESARVDLDALLREVTSRTTRWRIANETASMSTVREIESKIRERSVVDYLELEVERLKLAEWMQIGRRLLRASPEKLAQITAEVARLCDAHEATEERMSAILHPLPRDPVE